MANTRLFRKGMEEAGFRIVPGVHPIVPVLLGHLPDDAGLSRQPKLTIPGFGDKSPKGMNTVGHGHHGRYNTGEGGDEKTKISRNLINGGHVHAH